MSQRQTGLILGGALALATIITVIAVSRRKEEADRKAEESFLQRFKAPKALKDMTLTELRALQRSVVEAEEYEFAARIRRHIEIKKIVPIQSVDKPEDPPATE